MKKITSQLSFAIVVLFIAIFVANPVLAKNQSRTYDHYQKNHPEKVAHQSYDYRKGYSHGKHYQPYKPSTKSYRYFTNKQRGAVHKYYANQYRRGNCPPGFSKRHRQCVPRHYSRTWVIGRPLPPKVVYYDLPPQVLLHLGPAPSHHRFVRVAHDILLLATGTGMVVDAIDNINWEMNH